MMSNIKIGEHHIKLVVGLGNQGIKYQKNRHNLGFILLDNWFRSQNFIKNDKLKCYLLKEEGVIWAKPEGYINNSGDAVVKILNFYQLLPEEMLVIHDDLDLEFGFYKISFNRGSAGHNGIKDIFDKISTKSFYRLRFGIGRPSNPGFLIEDYVLSDFSSEELSKVTSLKPADLLSN